MRRRSSHRVARRDRLQLKIAVQTWHLMRFFFGRCKCVESSRCDHPPHLGRAGGTLRCCRFGQLPSSSLAAGSPTPVLVSEAGSAPGCRHPSCPWACAQVDRPFQPVDVLAPRTGGGGAGLPARASSRISTGRLPASPHGGGGGSAPAPVEFRWPGPAGTRYERGLVLAAGCRDPSPRDTRGFSSL